MREVIARSLSNLKVHLQAGQHFFVADEPTSLGGEDQGPDPYSLLLSALGACTTMTIELYARRKGWPLEEVEVVLTHAKIHASDCQDCEEKEGQIDEIRRRIKLVGSLTQEQKAKLMEIATKCPVHKTLTNEIKIRDKMVD
ncbi:MAG: OsmC family protein [Blastocatellia bacterium]|nr:OsmC family protein [Blastocatellia bacterium]